MSSILDLSSSAAVRSDAYGRASNHAPKTDSTPSNDKTSNTIASPDPVVSALISEVSCLKNGCETRKSKCRELRWQLHEYFRKNNDPTWDEIQALKSQLIAAVCLPSGHVPLTTSLLMNWFRDQRRYRRRYMIP